MGMKSWTRYRLVRWVAGRGPLAWWAWWRLIRAGDRGDTEVIDEVWDLWLSEPHARLWIALERWHRPRTGGGASLVALGSQASVEEVVAAAALYGSHPVAVAARARILAGPQELVDAACEAEWLAAFCVEHRLAPADPHRAAVFFLLTGQREQYHAVDPDHSLLAVAYQGADASERSRVLTMAAGHPDLARVLADTVRRGRLARLSQREAEYLAGAFARQRDWTGMWELTRSLPVLDAVAAVRRFDGWRPEGPDAALFDALAAADPDELTRAHRAVVTPWTVSARGTVTGGSFAPDGRRMAFTTVTSVDMVTLPSGVTEHWPASHHSEVLVLDGAALLISRWDHAASGLSNGTAGPAVFLRTVAFGRTPDGFAALTLGEERRPRLHLMTGSGPDFHTYDQRVLDVRTELGIPAGFAHPSWTMASEPVRGRIAIAGNDLHLVEVTGDGLRRLATVPFVSGPGSRLSFARPDRLLGVDDTRMLRLWRADGAEPRLVAERQLSGASMADLPGAGVVAVIDPARRVRYLDGETLADLGLPGGFEYMATSLFASPDGTRLAVGHNGFVEVLDVALAALADRPLAATTPADLHMLRTRLDGDSPFVELLHICLAHRFGVDVALGDPGPVHARDDDIALGEPA
ncbi:hypothetical protein [Actinophytocola sp.]|uniref:hypothetical protein n=1 Tax=Actinophytocola sp. TaxID=1872138 RepID=UPI002ED4DC61